jgi:hypothetical protein
MTRILTLVLVPAVVVSFALGGCAGRGAPSTKANKAYPAWVINPDYPGHIGVIGSAPRQDMGGRDAQYRVAMLKARQELAQMVRVHVDSTLRTKVEARGDRVEREADMQIRLRSMEALSIERARVVNEWVDPETGELYLMLVTPK